MLRRLFGSLSGPPDDSLERARALLGADRREEAIATISPWLKRHRDDADAHFVRGTALLELQRTREALPDLTRAAELRPREQRYLHNLAMAHWMLKDRARSMALCEQVLQLGDFREAHVLLSSIELPGEDYLNLIARLHQYLRPATFVEIGVFRGWSLRLTHPDTQVLGVDPNPMLEQPPGPKQKVYAETSDDFFATHDVVAEFGGRRVDMAFIDGMHRFEYALRDFINIERLARRDSVVLLHDCYPLDPTSASREMRTAFWSGDIWRLILILKKYRPDLQIRTIAAPPTGLGLILNLDPESRVLSDRLDSIVEEYMAVDYAVLEGNKREALNLFPNDWSAIQQVLDARPGAPAP